MHFTYQTIALAALTVSTIAQPAKHAHQHLHRRDLADLLDKRIDWNDPSLYKGVDWSKVDYSGDAGAANKPAPAPAPAPAPSPKVVAQAEPPQNKKPAVAAASAKAPVATQEKDTTTTSAGTGTGKRGLAYNSSSPALSIFTPYHEVTWAYNWDSASDTSLPSNLQFVPTLFSTAPDHLAHWPAHVKSATAGGGTKYIMAFNEPDQPAPQADMAPADAAAAYKQYVQPYCTGAVKCGSPSVSNGAGIHPATGRAMGLGWLNEFLALCTGCTVDFVPVHWYGCTNNCAIGDDVAAFQKQVGEAVRAVGGKKVWVTEFATLEVGNGVGFLERVLPWLDGQGGVERYAYFMAVEGSLVQGGGVSGLGKEYASG